MKELNLTNIEKDNVRIFLENGIMYSVIKKVLLSVTEVPYPELAEELKDNQHLGEKIRAMAEGRTFIEKGFDKLTEYQKSDIIKKTKNPAI